MNKSLQQVEEFHKLFKHPILDKPTIISKDRFKLRVSLIQEELNELIMAYEHEEGDKVEMLDALADLQYVLNGAILELGYKDVFDEAFDRVHKSNMSKACNSFEEAIDTIKNYFALNIESHYEKQDDAYLIYRSFDNKALKSINYQKVNLKDLV